MENFDEIRIEPNGVIEFDVGIGRKKKVTIQLQAVKVDRINGDVCRKLDKLSE